LETRFLNESGDYGELETSAAVLVFASHARGYFILENGTKKPIK
jgi:hypothetical protein